MCFVTPLIYFVTPCWGPDERLEYTEVSAAIVSEAVNLSSCMFFSVKCWYSYRVGEEMFVYINMSRNVESAWLCV